MPYINWYPLTSAVGLNSYFKFEIFYQYFRKLSLICKTIIYLPLLFSHYILYSIQWNSTTIYYSSQKPSPVYKKYSSPVHVFLLLVFCICLCMCFFVIVVIGCFFLLFFWLLLLLFFILYHINILHHKKTVILLPYNS